MISNLVEKTMNHPLHSTLEKFQTIAQWVKIRTDIPTEENWYSLSQLTKPETFGALLERYQIYAPYLSKRQAASSLYDSYSWWLTAAGLAPLLLDERLPDLATQLYFHAHDDGYCDSIALSPRSFKTLESDKAATHADATIVEREELWNTFLEQLEALLKPLQIAVQHHAALTDKALWLSVADGITGTVLWLRQAQHFPKVQVQRDAEMLLAKLPVQGKTGVLEVMYQNKCELFAQRSTCCYAYLSPEGQKCSTCPKLPLEARVERLQKYIAEKARQELVKVAA
jgi:ferric iron reductase protein FhuF